MRLLIPVLVSLLLASAAFAQHRVISVPDEKPVSLLSELPSPLMDQRASFTAHSKLLTPQCSPAPGQLPGFSRMKRAEKEWVCVYLEEPYLADRYGISSGLSTDPQPTPTPLLTQEQPMFNTASLHREEVVEDILKWIRKQEFDFSGVIEELYVMPVGFGGR